MSVEAYVLAAVIDEGMPGVKKAFQSGITRDDFPTYEEEWDWILEQAERKRVINWRRFQESFDDFERVVPNERIQDLCEELKRESAFAMLSSAMEQTIQELTPDNTLEKADFMREIIQEILRGHAPHSDIILSTDYDEYLRRMKELQILRENGEAPGIPTGIHTLDLHWGGLQNGRVVLVLGRPGDAKSFFQEKMYVEGFLAGYRMGEFSPEMNEDEHRARIATLLTADPRVQQELGITKALSNRALLDGTGYNYKTLKRLWQWVEKQPGAMVLHTNKMRRQKMSPSFIEARIDDLGLDGLIVDPIYKLKPSVRERNQAGWERIQIMTDEICDLAETFNIPIVISNQANRQYGNRGDAPHKDQSYNGDAPVQEADHVIGVKHITDENKLILRCTKNRFGKDFRVDVRFFPNSGVVKDLSRNDRGYYNGNEDGSEDKNPKEMRELEREMEHDER